MKGDLKNKFAVASAAGEELCAGKVRLSGVLYELAEGLARRRQRPPLMNDLVEIPLQFDSADRDFHENAAVQLAGNRNPRENRNSKTGDQSLLDGFGAAKFHGNIQHLPGAASVLPQ